jgi:hypothetical protein
VNVDDTAPAEILFQLLRYERAIPEDHTSRDGRLSRVQPVTERRVGAAVDASDPARILVHRPDARRLDDRGDASGGHVRISNY